MVLGSRRRREDILDVLSATRLQWLWRISIVMILRQRGYNGHCETRYNVSPATRLSETVVGAINLTSILFLFRAIFSVPTFSSLGYLDLFCRLKWSWLYLITVVAAFMVAVIVAVMTVVVTWRSWVWVRGWGRFVGF